MKARARNFIVAGVSAAALFGAASAGMILFYPEKLTSIQEKITAHAAVEYKLPAPSAPRSATGADEAFLKSFSKVFSNIAKEARPALVQITAEKKVNVFQPDFPEDFFFPFMPPQGPGGRSPHGKKQGVEVDAGSGFIVDLKAGYVITNNHVIDGANKITVSAYDNRKYKAKLIGTAKNLDIAVLKLEEFKPSNQIKQLSLANSDTAEVGDWAVALGAPFDLPQTLTMGVVSAVKRSSDVLGINGPNSFIQTDAPINPGNSGGPLVNLNGQVIGMNTAIYSKNGGSVGIGFAIPSNTIRLVADSIINNGKLTQAYLGVEMYPLGKFGAAALKEMKIDPNTEGGLVMRVVPASPASKAGLKPYDIIQSVNGEPVKSPSDIQAQIMFQKLGTPTKIGVLRNGKTVFLTAILSETPLKKSDSKVETEEDENEEAQQKTVASEYGMQLTNKKSAKGKHVAIGKVIKGSAADVAGLQGGDIILQVNKKGVSSVQDVEDILKKLKKLSEKGEGQQDGVIFLLIERDGNQSAIILQANG